MDTAPSLLQSKPSAPPSPWTKLNPFTHVASIPAIVDPAYDPV